MTVAIKKESTPKASNEEALWDKASALEAQINALTTALAGIQTDIAQESCPYKVGQRITTDRGLGKGGLEVVGICPPMFPTRHNRWEIQTVALSIKGEVTNRPVGLTEAIIETMTVKVAP